MILDEQQLVLLKKAMAPLASDDKREVAIEWAEGVVLDYDILQATIDGHLEIVGVNEKGEVLFRLTQAGLQYAELLKATVSEGESR